VPCCHGCGREIGDRSRFHLQAKFSAKDRACFELEDVEAADVGEELDIVAAAEQGSHSYATFKQAYANSATLNMK